MEIYNEFITTKLSEFMVAQDQEAQEERHQKNSFWCSESEKPVFDIYHAFIGTKPTNPIDAEKLILFSAGKMMEIALVEQLQKMGLAKEGEQERVEMERHGVPITGYMDIVFVDGTPGEVKSFYGNYQLKELKAGNPRVSYLKQLGIAMDYLGKEKGKLIYMDRGTGEMFEFTLLRTSGLKFKCLNVEFDLNDTYKRWARLYNNNIIPKIEPSPFECGKYKEDIDKIKWDKVSKSDIMKARNGHKVIGSDPANQWKILYSPYKELLLEKQGVKAGYTDAEIQQIKLLTKGYSTR